MTPACRLRTDDNFRSRSADRGGPDLSVTCAPEKPMFHTAHVYNHGLLGISLVSGARALIMLALGNYRLPCGSE